MEAESALTAFGFNQLESTVYCELLRDAPATGYRLAQRVGRVPANVYQALQNLLQKGAVVVEADAADATSYVPVPPPQLFAALRSGFLKRADEATATLAAVHRPVKKDMVAQLNTVPQVIERARSMLGKASEVVIFDAMQEFQDLLRPELDAARARGVRMAGIAYRAEAIGPTVPFKGEPSGAVRDRWPGLGLILVTDACEQLVAQISIDMTQVLNAVYSDSAFHSCIMHGLLQADIRLVAMKTEQGGALPPSPLDAFTLQAARPPGLRALLQR